MRQCKLGPGAVPVIRIEKEAFERETKKLPPYYDGDPAKDGRQYAVCPACDNPIQIVGLYKRLIQTEEPYGKHIPHGVENLAAYSQEDYEYCPFRRKTKITKSSRRAASGGVSLEILKLLRTQFDRVLYILSRDTGIRFGKSLGARMLKTYIGMQGHLYAGATLYNLPWIFGYMSNSQKLFGQYIRKDSPLARAIEQRCPSVLLVESEDGAYLRLTKRDSRFVDVNFCFIHHRQTATEHDLSETIRFCVSQGRETPPEEVYEAVIPIDPAYFLNLIHMPEENARRSDTLLAVADRELKSYVETP